MKAVQSISTVAQKFFALEVDDPIVGPGKVGVRVTHVGLNHLDVWVRRGVTSPVSLPLIPGSDVVGIREDTATRSRCSRAGCGHCVECRRDRHALCRRYAIRGETVNGGMCERVVVPESHLLPCPIPGTGRRPPQPATAAHAGQSGTRQAGDKVLIQAGASGSGSTRSDR